MLLLYLLTFLFSFQPAVLSKQFYDRMACSSPEPAPGSHYTCNSAPSPCNTFTVYRSRQGFNNVSDIAGLFDVETDQVLSLNNITNSPNILEENREIVLPIKCSCSGGFFISKITYIAPANTTYADISCDVFESLVKFSTLSEENAYDPNTVMKGMKLKVPLKCTCPDVNDTRNGFQYLVTYPIQESNVPRLVAEKFSIPLGDLLAQNSLAADTTVFPNTTVLVPVGNLPAINWNISDPGHEDPGFIPFTPSEIVETKESKKINLYVVVVVVGLLLIFVVLAGISVYCKAKNRRRGIKLVSSGRSSTPSCLSPDLIAVMSKYSLTSYTAEEQSRATKGFSEETKLGTSVHKGRIGYTHFAIKKVGFGDVRRTISIHSKINHANIVKLEGVCYGDGEFSPSFLIFEFARNGCLRDCLKNSLLSLPRHKRAQIAFDVAIGLYYIHHCTIPSYVHMNITSRNILITEDWRAKIANLGAGSAINSSREWGRDVAMTSEGWIAPEYLHYGFVSAKVDVFAFGVVLFELLSAEDVRDRSILGERLCFLYGGGGGTDCLDELLGFLDPNLKDYPIGDALCMTVLAKGCVEEDPMNRPSMNDILKILARMVR